MKSFNTEFKKKITKYCLENNYAFYNPSSTNKYYFKHVEKIPKDAITFIDDLEHLDDLGSIQKTTKNWKIIEGGKELFLYLLKNVNKKYKDELYGYHSDFSTFKNFINFLLINKEYDIAKEFFSSAKNQNERTRTAQEEELILKNVYSIYLDKNKFLTDLELFLINQPFQFNERYTKDSKQFMLFHFLKNNFEDKELLKPILDLLAKKPNDEVSDFLELPDYKTEFLKINNHNFNSSLKFNNISSYDIYDTSVMILSHLIKFFDTNFESNGLINCFRVYDEKFDTEDEKYTVIAFKLKPNSSIDMKDIMSSFVKATNYLASNAETLKDKEKIKDIFETLNKIILNDRLSSHLENKETTYKKIKI